MAEPVLVREVELPRTRSSGAAVVLVAAMAMFTAVGASAFVVRVRMRQGPGCPASYSVPPATPAAAPEAAPAPGEVLPVALVTLPAEGAELPDLSSLSDPERARVEAYYAAVGRGDPELALEIYSALPSGGDAQRLLRGPRGELARSYLETQLFRLDRELERRDCEAVQERLNRLGRLLPERDLPVAMDACR